MDHWEPFKSVWLQLEGMILHTNQRRRHSLTPLISHHRQLERLFEHRESLKNENSSLKENLNNEIQVQRDLQRRLNEAQSSETDAIRLKDQVSGQYNIHL